MLSVQIFASSKNLHFAKFIFTKQTRYGNKQKSNGPKMNENFTRKRKFTFSEDLGKEFEQNS